MDVLQSKFFLHPLLGSSPNLIGKQEDETWFKIPNFRFFFKARKALVEGRLTKDSDYPKIYSPYKQNRTHISVLRSTLKYSHIENIENIESIPFFSGIALEYVNKGSTLVDKTSTETWCDLYQLLDISDAWATEGLKVLKQDDINKIYDRLSQFTNASDFVKESHCKRLKEKYGTSDKNDILVNSDDGHLAPMMHQ